MHRVKDLYFAVGCKVLASEPNSALNQRGVYLTFVGDQTIIDTKDEKRPPSGACEEETSRKPGRNATSHQKSLPRAAEAARRTVAEAARRYEGRSHCASSLPWPDLDEVRRAKAYTLHSPPWRRYMLHVAFSIGVRQIKPTSPLTRRQGALSFTRKSEPRSRTAARLIAFNNCDRTQFHAFCV
jgi:hypothetical protein